VAIYAKDVMKRSVTSIGPNDTATEAMNRMIDEQFSRLPVIDEQGANVGVVRLKDILRHRLKMGDHPVEGKKGTLVGEVMREPLPCIDSHASLSEVFLTLGPGKALLVTEDEKVAGIVTPWDLLRYMHPALMVNDLEGHIRALLSQIFESQALGGYASVVPEAVLNEAKHRQERDPGGKREKLINYMDFGDYLQIFSRRDNWDRYFGGLGDKDEFETRYREVMRIRNDVAHSRVLSQDERDQLRANIVWVLKRLGEGDGRSRGSSERFGPKGE
jgi:CBS domain-containing protein